MILLAEVWRNVYARWRDWTRPDDLLAAQVKRVCAAETAAMSGLRDGVHGGAARAVARRVESSRDVSAMFVSRRAEW